MVLDKNSYGDVYKSNNILAMEYLKAMSKFNLEIKPYVIKRVGAGYNENLDEKINSATGIRGMIEKGVDIQKYVPYTKNLEYVLNYEDKLFNLFRYILNTQKLDNIYDLNEQYLAHMKKRVNMSSGYYDFLERCKAKNISITRIKRHILNVVLNIQKEDINFNISKIKVLGLNKKGASYIKEKNLDNLALKYKKELDELKLKELLNYLGVKKQNVNNVIYRGDIDDI